MHKIFISEHENPIKQMKKYQTYGPSNPVQNQPKNQMDILLVGGAFETLQCKDEQIWP